MTLALEQVSAYLEPCVVEESVEGESHANISSTCHLNNGNPSELSAQTSTTQVSATQPLAVKTSSPYSPTQVTNPVSPSQNLRSTVDKRCKYLMDASILIVGRDDFCQSILDAIQPSATLTLETAPNPQEAFPLIQAQQPDLVILSSQQPGILELCRNIRVNNRLTWMYCIAIDCVPSSLSSPFLSGLDSSDKLLQKQSNFLVEGADAFLALEASPTPIQRELLRAQIQSGLRRVQSHREIVRANDLLSAIALSDPLTELNNRRAFEWELPRQIHNARERNAPLSLLMLDVDFFKSINDQHGHLVGDRALKLISARLRHNLRFYDTPFRYGGEEFVIILNNTAAKEAQRIGQRLCQLMAQQAFNIDEQLELTITVSAGMASLRLDDDNKGTSLLRRADQYLLQAKSQGRNRILSAENEADVNVAMAEAEARSQQLNQIDVTPTSKNQN